MSASLARRARVAAGLLAAMALLQLALLASSADEYAYFRAAADGAGVSNSLRESLLSRVQTLFAAYLAVGLATVIAFLAWFYTATATARALTATNRLPRTPGDAVVAWFIPLVNLVRPLTITHELWLAADPDEIVVPPAPIEPGEAAYRGGIATAPRWPGRAPPIGLWWFALIVPVFAASRVGPHDHEVLAAIRHTMIIGGGQLVSAVCAVLIVHAISRDLAEKARRVTLAHAVTDRVTTTPVRDAALRVGSWTPWLCAALATGVGFAAGVWAVHARTDQYVRRARTELARNLHVQDPAAQQRLGAAIEAVGRSVGNDPATVRFAERLGAHDPAAVAAVLRAVASLPSDRLADWWRIRLQLAHASPEMCASLWTGSQGTPQAGAALASLDAATLQTYLSLQVEAVRLAVAAAPPPAIDPSEANDAIAWVAEHLSPERRLAFSEAVARGTGLTAPEACSAYLDLSSGVAAMPAEMRDRAIRALVLAQNAPDE